MAGLSPYYIGESHQQFNGFSRQRDRKAVRYRIGNDFTGAPVSKMFQAPTLPNSSRKETDIECVLLLFINKVS
jgi:hypothetical protein